MQKAFSIAAAAAALLAAAAAITSAVLVWRDAD